MEALLARFACFVSIDVSIFVGAIVGRVCCFDPSIGTSCANSARGSWEAIG